MFYTFQRVQMCKCVNGYIYTLTLYTFTLFMRLGGCINGVWISLACAGLY